MSYSRKMNRDDWTRTSTMASLPDWWATVTLRPGEKSRWADLNRQPFGYGPLAPPVELHRESGRGSRCQAVPRPLQRRARSSELAPVWRRESERRVLRCSQSRTHQMSGWHDLNVRSLRSERNGMTNFPTARRSRRPESNRRCSICNRVPGLSGTSTKRDRGMRCRSPP